MKVMDIQTTENIFQVIEKLAAKEIQSLSSIHRIGRIYTRKRKKSNKEFRKSFRDLWKLKWLKYMNYKKVQS